MFSRKSNCKDHIKKKHEISKREFEENIEISKQTNAKADDSN